jgi:oligosaccharyltransferase complex subunit beta
MMLWPKFKALAMLAQALVASQLLASVDARSAKGDKVLVVIEPALNRGSYSHFWKSLEGMWEGIASDIALCG